VIGALMLTRDNRAIAASLREVRYDMLTIAVAALGITVLLSLYLAGTIAQPIVRLARAADEIRLARESRPEIPDLGKRGDEIGDLNDALRSMTEALWQRINTIESFAADVAHELKNPLTSLRSAIEVAARPDLDPERRAKLMAIVVGDIERLNRLITDISNASRLDAELSRTESHPVELETLLSTLAEIHRSIDETRPGFDQPVEIALQVPKGLVVRGMESRLGQVFQNLIANAVSFSPPGGSVRVVASRQGGRAVVIVDDDGPGIPPAKLDAIFDRFYSERPSGEAFGTHSGLGLSISKQIVETLGGQVHAENRLGMDGNVIGARFVVQLPLA
jgi:two-component system sensor histidine kinase ChvG